MTPPTQKALSRLFLSELSRKFLALVLIVLISSPAAMAQGNAEGYIYGSATAAATVTAVNAGTNLERVVTADQTGNFVISGLPVGTYSVTVKGRGGEIQKYDNLAVRLGAGTSVKPEATVRMQSLDVAELQTMIDSSQTGAALNLSKETVDDLPLQRDLSSVMLLSPGVIRGDGAFGSVPSFAGASVAENNYFLNGFNITDFRHGTDYTRVPFDFQQDFQVQVGGYGAQYGRSLGGVTSVTSKTGGNKFQSGFSVVTTPERFRRDVPRTYQSDGSIYSAPDIGKSRALEYQAFASGPLLKNRLFFYALYDGRANKSEYAGTYATSFYRDVSRNPFWGGKVDWLISNSHLLEFTVTSDERTTARTTYAYDFKKLQVGASRGVTNIQRGGRVYIMRYSGNFSENIKISALFGKGASNLTNAGSGDNNPYIYDGRSGSLVPLGSWSQGSIQKADDRRKQYRVDATWLFRNHEITLGADAENNLSNDLSSYSGGVYWRYYAAPANGLTNGVANTSQYARRLIYNSGGSFKVEDSSFYVTDTIKLLGNRLLGSVGVRNEAFKNYNKDNKIFIEAKNQWAPRLGLSFDPKGDGKSKLFANYGLYYIPIAANTNIRASGGEYYTAAYFGLNGVNSDGTPILGSQLGSTIINSDGVAPNPKTLVDLNIKPMYQSELILGYQRQVNSNLAFTVRAMARNLESVIDDTLVPFAITRWAKRTGNAEFSPDADYVLFNPGRSLTFMADATGSGKLAPVTLSVDDLNMPAPIRKYYAVQLEVERSFSSRLSVRGSYTWSHNYGNFEGWVKSDNEQNDPGISAAYDGPDFMYNTYGNLPNDRRHVFKMYGVYRPFPKFSIGVTNTLSSGRPINKMGQPPSEPGVSGYANSYMMVPRGSLGNTPWVWELNTSLGYRLAWKKVDGRVSINVNNLLNRHTITKFNEFYEDANKVKNLYYGIPREFQSPQSVQATFELKF